MKEFKGTPGPWFLGGVENEKKSINASAYFIALVDEGACSNANANLIAAAPDLLGAVNLILELQLRGFITLGDKHTHNLKSAIAKALGESK